MFVPSAFITKTPQPSSTRARKAICSPKRWLEALRVEEVELAALALGVVLDDGDVPAVGGPVRIRACRER